MRLTRRRFVAGTAAVGLGMPGARWAHSAAARAGRLNVLWILGDDLGVELGCYGHPAVKTPNIDQLAAEGTLYRNAFTTAPVCSASRSALITGMYSTSIGAHHHRSHRGDGYRLPRPVKVITEYFRQAGYFTANARTPAQGLRCSGKTDFNFEAGQVFEGTDWSQRERNQPFYAQVNFIEPHRGGAGNPWGRTDREVKQAVEAERVVLPRYCAEHPVIRRDWASYLNAVQVLDEKVGKVIQRLKQEGLWDNTVVLFFGDNGRCHFRDKQFLYDGGIHVPLIVRWPGAKAGVTSDEPVSGIDVSATSLAAAGIGVPGHMQGRVFMGPDRQAPREVIFAARDRCDETVDRIRCVRDRRWKYIRNFMPQRPYTQPNKYKEGSYPALGIMKGLYAEGKLNEEQAHFFKPTRPAEELYDVQTDADEVRNLAGVREHETVLKRMRQQLEKWIVETKDQGQEDEAGDPKAE